MKRFWAEARAVATPGGHAIHLDGRPLRTPRRHALIVPGAPLAEAIAAEWQAAGPEVQPADLPLTGLANAAIDLVAPDPRRFAEGLAAFAAHDLTCYRAERPPGLVGRQQAAFEPLLAALEAAQGLRFHRTTGLVGIDQPPETLARVAALFAACDPFTLAALSPLVTLPGSAVIALALLGGHVGPAQALAAAEVDETFQEARWGEDPEAREARAGRARAFHAAARFLALHQQGA